MSVNKVIPLNDEKHLLKRAIIEAICHEIKIDWATAHKIDSALFDNELDKTVIETYQALYSTPHSIPYLSDITCDIFTTLIKNGWSNESAEEYVEKIDRIASTKQAPSNGLLYRALEVFSTDTTKESALGVSGVKNAHKVLKELCIQSFDNPAKLDDVTDLVVDSFNASHSVVRQGSKTLVCQKAKDHKDNSVFEFSQVSQMRTFYSNLNLTTRNGKTIQEVNLFDLWMKNVKRKDYYGVCFDPSNKASSDFLNLWEGFNVEPLEGEDKIQKIKSHLYHVICSGNADHYGYLLAWLAHMIQKPAEKSGVMVALRSDERGTGKSTLSVLVEKLLGEHAIRIQDSKHLLGSFNNHLANKLFVTIEEAFWSGSDKDAGKLRTMVTESTMTVEAKGRDAFEIDSFHRFLMCTNNEWSVPAHKDERRFFVLDVNPSKKSDTKYFDALYSEIKDPDAISQFFNYLQNYDISKYNLRKAPRTDALQTQIELSMKPHEQWLNHLLEDETFIDDIGQKHDLNENETMIPKHALYEAYINECNELNTPSYTRLNKSAFGRYITAVLKPVMMRPTRNGLRITCYQFKTLSQLKKLFSEYYVYE